jgi:hypothetical protein
MEGEMSDALTAQRAWVERVLGVRMQVVPARSGSDTRARWQVARDGWVAASQAVDAQISALQSVLHSSGTPALVQIAKFGLNAVTGNHKTRLMAMLLEMGDGSIAALAQNGTKARKLLDEFSVHIANDPRVAACDNNPFGVAVSIRATIGPALKGLQAALQSAA